MQKNEKISLIDSALLLLRRLLILTVIVVVAVPAIFWESLPAKVKKTVTSLSASHSDDDENALIPRKYRLENNSEISANISAQTSQDTQFATSSDKTDLESLESTEFRNAGADHVGLDNETLDRLQDELRQLGASACRLTWWGDGRTMFRFTCQIPIDVHNPGAVRTFQSIAPDATRSMQEVIDQVRQWRGGE